MFMRVLVCKRRFSGCRCYPAAQSNRATWLPQVLLYVFYTKSHSAGEQCHENKFFISANLLLGMLCTAVAISDSVQQYNPNSGLLQSGIVVSYITYLTWSAVSNNVQACQPTSLEANDNATTIIGAMITFIAVAYSSLRTSSASQLGSLGMGDSSESTALLTADADADDDELEGDDDGGESGGAKKGRKQHVVDDEGDAVLYNWSFFHLTFAFASLYLMMVLTDWAVIRDGTQVLSAPARPRARFGLAPFSAVPVARDAPNGSCPALVFALSLTRAPPLSRSPIST